MRQVIKEKENKDHFIIYGRALCRAVKAFDLKDIGALVSKLQRMDGVISKRATQTAPPCVEQLLRSELPVVA